ncbi:MAG: DUF5689 domain-containing protein [Flavobacterium sp.]|nr:DUF5689 domain-containing protein [Flavobacterium sp.]
MKTTILKSVLFLTLAASFTSCVNDDDYAIPTMDCTETSLVKTIEVSAVPFGTLAQYTGDDVIEAYVTSSDEGGNFFKAISFQTLDGLRAFSVPVDVSSTFVNLEPGRKVFIKLQNLYTDSPTTGAIGPRIGGIYVTTSGIASVGRLGESQYKEALVRSCTAVDEELLVHHVTIPQLIESGNMYLNKLVELDNVQFSNDAIGKTYYIEGALNTIGGATNIPLIDVLGNSVDFRTSSFANFAGKIVPSGSGKVRGVLTKYNSGYQFLARTERDVQLTSPRFKTLLNEAFTSNLGEWTTYSVIGGEVWAHSAQYGNPGGMAKMSGYNNGNKNNEDWLISPVQDLTGLANGATLSFDNAYKFDGNPIVVLISKDYDGIGNPSTTGTWTVVPGAVLSTGNYAYANSGNLDISDYTGAGTEHVYVAFKYTSTTTAASTWEIDNVKILPLD